MNWLFFIAQVDNLYPFKISLNWLMLRSRPYPRTQAPRSVEEGGRIFRGDEGVDVESGGQQEIFRLEDAVDLIVDTLGHLHNRNGSYISTVK